MMMTCLVVCTTYIPLPRRSLEWKRACKMVRIHQSAILPDSKWEVMNLLILFFNSNKIKQFIHNHVVNSTKMLISCKGLDYTVENAVTTQQLLQIIISPQHNGGTISIGNFHPFFKRMKQQSLRYIAFSVVIILHMQPMLRQLHHLQQ